MATRARLDFRASPASSDSAASRERLEDSDGLEVPVQLEIQAIEVCRENQVFKDLRVVWDLPVRVDLMDPLVSQVLLDSPDLVVSLSTYWRTKRMGQVVQPPPLRLQSFPTLCMYKNYVCFSGNAIQQSNYCPIAPH